MILAAVSSTGLSDSALVIVLTIAIAGGGLVFAALTFVSGRKDRTQDTQAKIRDGDNREISLLRADIQRISETLGRFMRSILGSAADPVNNIPEQGGFIQEQRLHNGKVDEQLKTLTDEIATTNGGGTVKGSLGQLRTEVAGLKGQVQKLVGQNENPT